MNKETMQESSVPVQSRVSIVTLAQMARYWEVNETNIRTVSQLVSWSLYLLADILKTNGHLEREPSVAEAKEYMVRRELFQQGTVSRGMKKLDAAIRFEGLREEGIFPRRGDRKRKKGGRDYNEMVYAMLHKDPNRISGEPSSVEPWGGSVSHSRLDEAVRIFNSIKDEDVRRTELTMGDRLTVRQGMTPEEAAEVIKANEEIAQRDLDALNSLDLSTLSPVTEQEKGE